jgi:hypothetical protein
VWVHDAWHAATNAHCVTNMPTSGAQAQSANVLYRNWAATEGSAPIDRTDPSIYHIRLGSLDRTSGGQVYHIRKIAVSDSWEWGAQDAKGRVGDVALLTLDRPVLGFAPPLVLPVNAKRSVREVGWGFTSDDGTTASQFLNQIDVPPLLRSVCDSGPAPAGIDEVCSDQAARGGGACSGDSGTAAFQRIDGRRWAAVGSTSRPVDESVPCSQALAIYTNLSYYAGWFWQQEFSAAA